MLVCLRLNLSSETGARDGAFGVMSSTGGGGGGLQLEGHRRVHEHGVGLAGLDAGADDVREREHGDDAGEATGEATRGEATRAK